MSLRSLLGRVAIATAAGALLSSALAAPALADSRDDGGDPGASLASGWDGHGNQGGGGDPGGNGGQGGNGNQGGGGGQGGTGNHAGGGGQGGTGNQAGGGQGGTGNGNGNGNGNQGGGGDPGGNGNQGGGGGQGGNNDQRFSRGVVTASTLNLRSAPNRGSQVIRVAHRGERVSIFCKAPGQSVDGNNVWYLLADGTWAWGSARYIDTIGNPPRWC
jgi:uncharacterized protein YgiM (DUF1202 family)